MPFKKDFLWGGAVAANQCEGPVTAALIAVGLF